LKEDYFIQFISFRNVLKGKVILYYSHASCTNLHKKKGLILFIIWVELVYSSFVYKIEQKLVGFSS